MDRIRIFQSRIKNEAGIFTAAFCPEDPGDQGRLSFALLAAADGSLKDSPLAAQYAALRLTDFVKTNEKALCSMSFASLAGRIVKEAGAVDLELSHIASVKGYNYRADYSAFFVVENSFIFISRGDCPAFVCSAPVSRRLPSPGQDRFLDGILSEGASLVIASPSLGSTVFGTELSSRLRPGGEKALNDLCDFARRRGAFRPAAVMLSYSKAEPKDGAKL